MHYAGGPRRPPPPQLHLRRSRDLAHASIPLAQTPWGLTGRAWLQAGAQQAVIAVDPSFKSLGIDSRNGLIGRWHQAIIWTSDDVLSVRPLGTNFSAILIPKQNFSLKKKHLKMSAKYWPFSFGISVLTHWGRDDIFKCIFLNEKVWISIKSLFLRVQLTISKHWFR